MMMQSLLVALAAGAGGATPAPVPVPVEAESVLRRYDLTPLTGRYNDYTSSFHLFPASYDPHHWDDVGAERQDSLSGDEVHELIYSLLGEEIEYEGRRMWMSERGALVLSAPEGVQARVREVLGFLSEIQSPRTRLLVDVVSLPAGTAALATGGAVVDEAQADRLVQLAAQGGSVESYVLQLSGNGRGRVAATRHHAFVGDYDVEVAQDAFGVDPIELVMTSGLRLEVRATPSRHGTRLGLSLSHGEALGEPEPVEIDLSGMLNDDGAASFELAAERLEGFSIAQRSMSLQTALPPGKALVLRTGLRLERAAGTQLVVLRQQGPGLRPILSSSFRQGPGELHLISVGALAPAQFEFDGAIANFAGALGLLRRDHDNSDVELWSSWSSENGDEFMELCSEALDEVYWGSSHDWIHVYRGPDEDAEELDLRRDLVAAVDALMPDVELVQISLRVDRGGDGGAAVEVDLPLLVGVESGVSLGIESTVVRDYNVEIAQGSSIMDPVTGFELDGASFVLRPQRLASGGLQLEIRGAIQLRNHARVFDARGPALSPVQLPGYDRLLVDQTLDLSDGGAVVGDASPEGRGGAVRLQVQVR